LQPEDRPTDGSKGDREREWAVCVRGMEKTDEELLAPLARFAPEGAELEVETCMQDGLLLLAFLEDWTGIHYPKNPEPKTDGDRYKNVTIALQALLGLFDMEVDFTPDDIVEGRVDKTRELLRLLSSEEFQEMEMDDEVKHEMEASEKMKERFTKKFNPAECDLSQYDEGLVIVWQCLFRKLAARKVLRRHRKRREDRVQRLMEIITTEETYVTGLDALCTVYKQQLEFNAKVSPDPLMAPDDITTVFMNCEAILAYNKTVLEALHERSATVNFDTCVGDILSNMAPFLSLYTHYCNNYDRGIALMDTLRKKDPKLDEFLIQCKTNPMCKNLDIMDLLIMPVQRVPRYILLIEQLLLHTPQTHADHDDLGKAYSAIKTQMASVNDKIGKSQKMHEVLLIQQRLIGDDVPNIVMPSRHFITEGTLQKVNLDAKQGKEVDTLCVFLFNDCILYTKKEGHKLKFRGLASLAEGTCRVKDIPDMEVVKNAFSIISPDQSLTLSCESMDKKFKWINLLNKQIALGMEVRHQRFQSMKMSAPPSLKASKDGVHNLSATITGTKVLYEKGDPFTCYCIQVTPNDRGAEPYTVYRRYREFDELHKAVRKKFDHHTFVPLPKKHFINNLKNDIVESRRIVLETFLEDALMKPDVCNSSEFVIFLMPSDNYTDAQTLSTKSKATKLKQPEHLKQQAKLKKLQEKKEKKKRGSIFFGGSKEKKKKDKATRSPLAESARARPESDDTPGGAMSPREKRMNRAATVDVLLTPAQAAEHEKERAARMLQRAISPRLERSSNSSSELRKVDKTAAAKAVDPGHRTVKVSGKRSNLPSIAPPTAPVAVPPPRQAGAPVPATRSPLSRSPGAPVPAARQPSAGAPAARQPSAGTPPGGGAPPPKPRGPPPKPATPPPKPTSVPPKPAGMPPRPMRVARPAPAAAVAGQAPATAPAPVATPAAVPPPKPSQPPPAVVPDEVLAALSEAVPERPPPPVPL